MKVVRGILCFLLVPIALAGVIGCWVLCMACWDKFFDLLWEADLEEKPGFKEHFAGIFCYLGGWAIAIGGTFGIIGLMFYLISKLAGDDNVDNNNSRVEEHTRPTT